MLLFITPVYAVIETDTKQAINTVSYTHVLNWALGLVIVLALFLACVWIMKKMGALPTNNKDGMRVVSGLSLGMREKLVLVQVGDKQLLLGVTPGRVEKLLVLEGEDVLYQQVRSESRDGDFSQKLKQIMSGSTHE